MKKYRFLASLLLVLTVLPNNLAFQEFAVAVTVNSGDCVSDVTNSTGVLYASSSTDCYLAFTTVGANVWTPPNGVTSATFLIVAGGGAGGSGAWGGGGGAGGVVYFDNYAVSGSTPLNLSVGAGGTAGSGAQSAPNNFSTNGSDSWINSSSTNVAKGGGAGASYSYNQSANDASGNPVQNGRSGGSGGGGTEFGSGSSGGSSTQSAINGAVVHGYAGAGYNASIPCCSGGGGGGAGGAGAQNLTSQNAGAGGIGINTYSNILNKFSPSLGVSGYIAGGGGGGGNYGSSDSHVQALGGSGGGGNGGWKNSRNGSAGLANTGGGGGGASYSGWIPGSNGGSGLIVIKFAKPATKTTPTLTWSNVTKSYGDSPFTLTTPTASTAGTFTYSSATPGVIALNNANTDSATVVAPGTSVITASFTPTDTATYNSATTTMTVTVSKAAQAALTFALSTASKNQPYSQAITMTPSGGTGTGAITYAIAAGGSASSCALANSTETNTITATSGGTCLIQATKATDTNYLVATSATQTFTFNPPLTLTYVAGELGTGTVPTLSGTYFAADTATVAAGSTLSRAGFTFNGWRNSSNAAVAAGSTFTFSTSETLTAQWRQSSLFGLNDNELTELQSWNASVNNVSSTISNASSSFTVTIPGSSLPTGTTVKLWEIGNSNLALSKLGSGKDYILNLVVSWLKSDGTVPTATSPVTISISNNTIKNGAIAYQIIGDTVTPIGTATADGVINLSVTEDPAITVANPAVVASPGSGSSGSSGSSGDPSPSTSSSGGGSLAGGDLGSKPRPALVTPTTPILKTNDGKAIFTAKGDTKRIVDGVVKVELVQIMNETSIKTELSGVVLEIQSIDNKNLDKKLDASNTLIFEQTGKAALKGTGFKPVSTVKVWIFSEPTFLGEIPVNSDGTFDAKLLVPASLPTGDHTLQINGVSPSEELMSQTIGILVVAPVVTEAKPAIVKQEKNLVVMSHKVGFGRSAAWINTNNIMAIRKFMSQASERFAIKQIIIKGYEQPSTITLPKIDLARANAVRKFLRNEGYNYPVVVKGMGVAKSRSADLSRVAVLTIEGKLKSSS